MACLCYMHFMSSAYQCNKTIFFTEEHKSQAPFLRHCLYFWCQGMLPVLHYIMLINICLLSCNLVIVILLTDSVDVMEVLCSLDERNPYITSHKKRTRLLQLIIIIIKGVGFVPTWEGGHVWNGGFGNPLPENSEHQTSIFLHSGEFLCNLFLFA